MGELTEKPEEIGMDAKSPAVRDRVDLGHEMAGLETGRIKRFLPEGASGYGADTEEKKAERRYHSLLDMLLAEDPHYAALYARVSEKIIHSSRAVDQALIEINQRLEAADRELRLLREFAATLPDGTKVFHSEVDGNIYTEDGIRLSAEEAQDIHIPNGAPKWEDYRAQKDAYDTAARQKEEIEKYRDEVVDPARERLNDHDNPPLKDELEELERRLESEMPEFVKKDFQKRLANDPVYSQPSASSVAHDLVDKTELNVPDMSRAFDLARVDIPDMDPAPPDIPAPTRTLG